jgi:hypothetical protein
MRTCLAVLAMTTGLLAPALVWADESDPGSGAPLATPDSPGPIQPYGKRRAAVAFNLGIGSAVGEIGVTGGYATTSFLQTELGIGVGFTGMQISSLWLNVDLAGMEIRTARNFVFFVAGGFTTGLLGGRLNTKELAFHGDECYEPTSCNSKIPGLTGPQGRIGLGRWF